jgi:hypothetical protein
MRSLLAVSLCLALSDGLSAQPRGKFPPDSLVNTKVIPRSTAVTQVIGMMRNITSDLGVRCQFCHVGEEGLPLEQFDFISDEKRNKQVARQMMRMVEEINRRVDTLPGLASSPVAVTCATCHRGVTRPVPLVDLLAEAAIRPGADSAVRAYRALRERYYGRDAYDFGARTLAIAAFRVARAQKFDEAFVLLRLNDEHFPPSAANLILRGNINLMKGDTLAAAAAFREAIRLDPGNGEARGRLRAIGQTP